MVPTPPARLPLSVTTLYAELLDLSESDALEGYAWGTYVRKAVKGTTYWYRQTSFGKQQIQRYLGRETPALLAEIEDRKRSNTERREELRRRREICRALRTGVGRVMDATTGRILKALSEAGAFEAGAILIGSQAYGIYPAMLGRRIPEALTRTGDVDFAAVHIAVDEPVSFAGVTQAAVEAMFIVPPAPHSRLSTRLKMQGSDYRVELLTPARGGREGPVLIDNLKFAAQPLPFLDYLIERPVEAVAPVDVGVRVKVPAPERFALHKLIVAQARDRSQFAKREKDLAQARELIAVLREDLPAELAAAWADLVRRGPAYADKAEASLRLLDLRSEDLTAP